ncbi:MAG: hypothetical protein IT308_09465 [Anaerolineaceae bacterium]|nr:hypothetical protein [Anaerolineaceae bacterium]
MALFSMEMLRTLKGPPLAVLIALLSVRQPVQADWLARATGYSDKPVKQALELLAEYGMATRNGRYAWQIADGVQPLPFLDAPAPEAPAATPAAAEARGKVSPVSFLNRKVSETRRKDSHSFPVTTAAVSEGGEKEEQQQLKAPRKNSGRKHKLSAVEKCLYDGGIRGPMLQELAGLGWVTQGYVRAMVIQAQREKISTGLLIHRIRSQDDIRHTEGCTCRWCEEQHDKANREFMRWYNETD